MATRVAALWCSDWAVASWGIPSHQPAAVFESNRVVATSQAGREQSVAIGMTRREAQSRCPNLTILHRNQERETRLFEHVVARLDDITPRVEVVFPGLVQLPTLGPSRFFGGDKLLAEKMLEVVEPALPVLEGSKVKAAVGVADGGFAARLAARSCTGNQPSVYLTTNNAANSAVSPRIYSRIYIVEKGASRRFLAPFPIRELLTEQTAIVLSKLGITSLGMLADLPAGDVLGRFGIEGQLAHRLASGEDEHPLDLRQPETEHSAVWAFDTPVKEVEHCVYAVGELVGQVNGDLQRLGLRCTKYRLEALTEEGKTLERIWSGRGTLSLSADNNTGDKKLIDRLRQQLAAWLSKESANSRSNSASNSRSNSPAGSRAKSQANSIALVEIRISADEVIADVGRQLGLWGARNQRGLKARNGTVRLQSLVGDSAITGVALAGGIGPAERIRPKPASTIEFNISGADQYRVYNPNVEQGVDLLKEPWPGKLPSPSPSVLLTQPLPVEIVGDDGPMGVTGRGELKGCTKNMSVLLGPKTRQRVSGAGSAEIGWLLSKQQWQVTSWSAPWPVDQKWWNPLSRSRKVHLQVILENSYAILAVLKSGQWMIQGFYN